MGVWVFLWEVGVSHEYPGFASRKTNTHFELTPFGIVRKLEIPRDHDHQSFGVAGGVFRAPPTPNVLYRFGVGVPLFGGPKFRERGFWISPPVGGYPAIKFARL